MDREQLGSGPIEVAGSIGGGSQNILVRFSRAGRNYVLRRPPLHQRDNSNETMRREARLLKALARTRVPHPRLIADCGDESVLGAAFYLMEPVDGFNPVSGLPSLHAGSAKIQHRMGLALVEAIAELGSLDHQALGLADFGKPAGFLERQVPRWRAQLEGYFALEGWPGPKSLGDVEGVGTWLDGNRPTNFDAGIMHGDYHLANVMYRHDGPELAAVVDWELATIGDPLVDLGWLLATWPERGDEESTVKVQPWIGFPTANELVDHYASLTRRDLSRIGWYEVLACYKLGILLEGTHARASAGQASGDVGDRLHARAVRLFKRAERLIA
jgi:aminoglycoside phosphotransferase (APT) family kinase protein